MTKSVTSKQSNYWEFATHLTDLQWKALNFLIITKESTPDTEVNRILGEYLNKVDVPEDFNGVEW